MSGAVIGALRAELSAGVAAFAQDMNKAADQVKGFAAKFASIGANLQSAGAAMTVGITAPLTAFMGLAIPAATEAAQAAGQVRAALQSMGDGAGRTEEQLAAAAEGLMKISTFDDDEILRKVTANLLTFGTVAGEQFDRAQLAAVNLSARLGQDLQASTMMVGKALNDPVRGITAMRRVGIQFTADQEKMIEGMVAVGDTAGAQRVILAELERQFGGSAQALRDATPGQDLRNAWDSFQEVVGEIALKVLPPITAGLAQLLEGFNGLDPGIQTAVVGVGAFLAAAGPVIATVGGLISGLTAIGTVAAPAVAAAAPVIGGALTLMTGPIGIVIAIVGALVAAWVFFGDDIKRIAGEAWRWVQEMAGRVNAAVRGMQTFVLASIRALVEGIGQWFVNRLRAIFDGVRTAVDAVGQAFRDLYQKVVGGSYVPDMVTEVGQWMDRLEPLMVQPAGRATSATAQAFAQLHGEVAGLLERLATDVERASYRMADDTAILERAHRAGIITAEQYAEALRRVGAAYAEATAREVTAPDLPKIQTPDQSGQVKDQVEKTQTAAEAGLAWAMDSQAWQDRARDNFARSFADGVRAAMDGNAGDWLRGKLQQIADNMFDRALTELGNVVFDKLFSGMTAGSGGGGGGGFFADLAKAIIPGIFGGARAAGGPVNPGKAYLVGEEGPELFRPRTSGSIIPNGAGGMTQVFNITTPDPNAFRASQGQIARAARRKAGF